MENKTIVTVHISIVDWAIIVSMLMFVLDSFGLRNFTPLQITSPLVVVFLIAMLGVIVQAMVKKNG